jgi:predicted nuclease of predicted toxin-antitoxin system
VHAAKLDENVPVEAAELLRAAGWHCDTVHDEGLAGADDPRDAAACQAGGLVLFTLDLDFADIRAYPPKEYAGIVVFRPAEPSRRQVLDLVARVLPVFDAAWIDHQLWIVEPARVRVRGAHDAAV